MYSLILILLVTQALAKPHGTETEASGTEASGVEAGANVPTASTVDEAIAQLRADLEGSAESGAVTPVVSTGATTTEHSNGCKVFDTCYSNDDCPGGSCLGTFVGKCNCQGCMNFFSCKTDADCGGLKGACSKFKFCDCNEGFKKAGYPFFIDAMTMFCNQKTCKVLLLILTLTSTFCFPMLEDDDAVLVASGELTDKEVAALDLKTLSNSATVVHLNGDTVEGSGEGIFEVDEQAESTLGKPQASEEFRALESKCEEWELCYRDSDCHGGKCLGIFVGTCNCNACLDLWL
nr:Chondroitin proteoglycan 3 [Haemonchus contortus]